MKTIGISLNWVSNTWIIKMRRFDGMVKWLAHPQVPHPTDLMTFRSLILQMMMMLVWQGMVMKDKNTNDNGETSFVYSCYIYIV